MSQVFSFQDHTVRTIIENGQLWFVAKDIAVLLGYTKSDKEVRRVCKHVELFKGSELVPLKNAPRGLLIIPEPDVWRLVIRSNLPKAQEVEAWIMGEVLPAIRKTGKYEAKPAPKPKALPKPKQPALPAPDELQQKIDSELKRVDFYIKEIDAVEKRVFALVQENERNELSWKTSRKILQFIKDSQGLP